MLSASTNPLAYKCACSSHIHGKRPAQNRKAVESARRVQAGRLDSSRTRSQGLAAGMRQVDSELIYHRAKGRSIELSFASVGLFFGAEASFRSSASTSEKIGYVKGYVNIAHSLPVHLDEMRIYNQSIREIERKRAGADSLNVIGAFGAGLLLGTFALARLREMGYCKAELLAINDNEYQYRRLVKYYQRMGFKNMREVGSGESPWFVELADQLTWGGCGMLMTAEIDDILCLWSRSLMQ